MHVGRLKAALFLSTTLAACGGIRAAPEPPMANFDTYLLELQQPYAPAAIIQCINTPVTEQQQCRDAIVQALMVAVDLRYEDFELGFFDANRYAGFGATLATLGLSTAGAVVSGGTSQLLSTAAAGVTGAREAFKREVLSEQTSVALLTAMRAQRDKVGERIRLGLRLDATQYPLGAALADVSAYYRAGTLVGALTGVTEAVGIERRQAEQDLRLTVVGRGFSSTERAVRLRAYLRDPGVSQAERDHRRREFEAAKAAVGLGDIANASLLTNTGAEADERLARIEERMNFSAPERAASIRRPPLSGAGVASIADRAARLRSFLRDPTLSQAEKDRRRREFETAKAAEGLGDVSNAELLSGSGPQADERLGRIAGRMKMK